MSKHAWVLQLYEVDSCLLHYMREPTAEERAGFDSDIRNLCYVDEVKPTKIPMGFYPSTFFPEDDALEPCLVPYGNEGSYRISAWDAALYSNMAFSFDTFLCYLTGLVRIAEEQKTYMRRFFSEQEADRLNRPYRDIPFGSRIPHYFTEKEYERLKWMLDTAIREQASAFEQWEKEARDKKNET